MCASKTFLMITDSIGKQIADIISFPTELNFDKFVQSLGANIKQILGNKFELASCSWIGIVLPGILDRKSGVVLHAPTLGWYDVNLLPPLEVELDSVKTHLKSSGKACILSQIWKRHKDDSAFNDIVFVSVSDGLGVRVVINGELMRGKHNTVGEFGHVPLSIDWPVCSCGANDYW